MIDATQALNELSRFADLDSEPRLIEDTRTFTITFKQLADDVVLLFDKSTGSVSEQRAHGVRLKYSSYAGLLVSPGFGNLKRFADAQKALIVREAPYIADADAHLPIASVLETSEALPAGSGLSQVNTWLQKPSSTGCVRALVVDGPAGIGKTHVVRSLTYQRALAFGPGSPRPRGAARP